MRAKVILFKASGKYYTEEEWEIPTEEELKEKQRNTPREYHDYVHVPTCMQWSKDFRRIGRTGAVLIESQEPWGFPHLFPAITLPELANEELEMISSSLNLTIQDHDWRAGTDWNKYRELFNKINGFIDHRSAI